MNKFFKNLIGFCIVAYLLFGLYSCIHTNIDKKNYQTDVKQATKIVENLEKNVPQESSSSDSTTTAYETSDTLDIRIEKLNKAIKKLNQLTSDDGELETTKKEIQDLREKYSQDYDYKISDLDSRVEEVERRVNSTLDKYKEDLESTESNLKWKQTEASQKEKEESSSASSSSKKVDLEAYYNSIQSTIDTVNSRMGFTYIDSMDKTSVTPGVNIYLSANVTAYSITEIQAQISAFNQSLVNIARSQGVNSPRFYYHLSGQQVAVNRYILAPEEVKFSGILK